MYCNTKWHTRHQHLLSPLPVLLFLLLLPHILLFLVSSSSFSSSSSFPPSSSPSFHQLLSTLSSPSKSSILHLLLFIPSLSPPYLFPSSLSSPSSRLVPIHNAPSPSPLPPHSSSPPSHSLPSRHQEGGGVSTRCLLHRGKHDQVYTQEIDSCTGGKKFILNISM
jgi:hypothetical protein